ncbi:S26 family signal peptidase [Dermatophilaceae bacterium Soc4.6]
MGWPRVGVAVVHGRSMEPTLHEGDRLLVAYGVRALRGRLAIVRLPDGESGPRPPAVKRVTHRAPGGAGWWVERDNPAEGVDSWLVGAVPEAGVLGLVVCRLPRLPGPLGRWMARRPG